MEQGISTRLQVIFEMEGITASIFADKIGVQRSAISHILSGRNKPGFDLLQKIIANYPNISTEWLISGNGEPYKQPAPPKQPSLFDKPMATEPLSKITNVTQGAFGGLQGRTIERIVIFYSDKTFETYNPQ
ncbi:MAG: helix-turn-helix transcriptional regulator [Bacteroidales bacterium]|nr:helix-turn-helix transcriptional regulator [Bacteroidales bacterium]MBN2749166.1 helix-turn-helix transcriptional regulator [Bacteroidales bacterium]